jgi:hypothetical protein
MVWSKLIRTNPESINYMKLQEPKSFRRLFDSVIILFSIISLTIWLTSRSKPTLPHLEQYSQVIISSELTSIPNKFSFVWTSTRDKILRKSTIPTSPNHRYGLQFNITNQNVHLLICILLAGDIATNPGPCSARCLVVNARSLVSIHKTNGKKSCHLTNFQNLVYTEQADLVWVTETWFSALKSFLGATTQSSGKTANLVLVVFSSLSSRLPFLLVVK